MDHTSSDHIRSTQKVQSSLAETEYSHISPCIMCVKGCEAGKWQQCYYALHCFGGERLRHVYVCALYYHCNLNYVYLCECLYQRVSWRGLNIASCSARSFIISCDKKNVMNKICLNQRVTPKVLDHYLHHDLVMLQLLIFAHLLVLKDPDHHHNLISPSLYHPKPLHKISSQSIHNVLSNVVHKQTDRQTDQFYQKHNLVL